MGSPGQGADQAGEADTPITARHGAMSWAQLEKTAPDQHPPELPLGARAPPTQARLIRCAPESR